MDCKIAKEIAIAEIRLAKPKTIYYGAMTCWWTHNPKDLGDRSGLPCDPRGGVLFETSNVEKLLKMAEKNPSHYGEYGVRAFMLAHHGCIVTTGGQPWCFSTWDQYTALIIEHDFMRDLFEDDDA